ncbi:hypothetical protein XAB3213_4250006 [Xanthomonas citri pv. bilvae]|nr:hypothetical protein XAB3213_4250006 [Xanthomonas citri pv. bilvae]
MVVAGVALIPRAGAGIACRCRRRVEQAQWIQLAGCAAQQQIVQQRVHCRPRRRRRTELQQIQARCGGGGTPRRRRRRNLGAVVHRIWQRVECRRRRRGCSQRLHLHMDLEAVQLQAVAIAERGRVRTRQRSAVERHAVGAAVLDEIHPVEKAHHRMRARDAGRGQHPIALVGAADAAPGAGKALLRAGAELRGLRAADGEDQLRTGHAMGSCKGSLKVAAGKRAGRRKTLGTSMPHACMRHACMRHAGSRYTDLRPPMRIGTRAQRNRLVQESLPAPFLRVESAPARAAKRQRPSAIGAIDPARSAIRRLHGAPTLVSSSMACAA